jgi:hypothetical protein
VLNTSVQSIPPVNTMQAENSCAGLYSSQSELYVTKRWGLSDDTCDSSSNFFEIVLLS